jgi:lipoate-protein ligase B
MVEVKWLGRVPYAQAWDLQRNLVAEKRERAIADQLLLLEHDPVYTLGRSGQEKNLLLDEVARRQAEIDLYWVDRGGDVTYHGPGQLVGYPILDIKEIHKAHGLPRPDLHLYLRQLEAVLIKTLAAYDLSGRRYAGYTGVWVDTPAGPRKIAAIGVKVNARGITSHGFALNIDPDLGHFAGIIPCGIAEHGVTSMARLLNRSLTLADVLPVVVKAFAGVFQVETRFVTPLIYA